MVGSPGLRRFRSGLSAQPTIIVVMPIAATCSHCGAAFSHAPSQRRQFCSLACSTAARRLAGGWEQRICGNCGDTFDIAGGRIAQGGGAYCSDDCRVANKAIQPRICEVCGHEFWSRHAGTFCCSKTCGGIWRRTRITRPCPVCGVMYEAEVGRLALGKDLHCSRACAFPGPVNRFCERCGEAFTANRSEIAKGWGRFCSNKCRRTRVIRVCPTCGLAFEVTASKVTYEIGKYCSVDCRPRHAEPCETSVRCVRHRVRETSQHDR
jgi:hypothetical protein